MLRIILKAKGLICGEREKATKILKNLGWRYLGVSLCCLNATMPEHFAHGFNRHSIL